MHLYILIFYNLSFNTFSAELKIHFNLGEEYPLCGKYNNVNSFKDESLKEEANSLPFCLHIEGGFDWSNLKLYKVLEIKKDRIKLQEKKSDPEWIKLTKIITPLTIESHETGDIFPLPSINLDKILIIGQIAVFNIGSNDICSYNNKTEIIYTQKKFSRRTHSIVIPKTIDPKKLILKKYLNFDYARACGT